VVQDNVGDVEKVIDDENVGKVIDAHNIEKPKNILPPPSLDPYFEGKRQRYEDGSHGHHGHHGHNGHNGHNGPDDPMNGDDFMLDDNDFIAKAIEEMKKNACKNEKSRSRLVPIDRIRHV
jgi:hypothetical protein